MPSVDRHFSFFQSADRSEQISVRVIDGKGVYLSSDSCAGHIPTEIGLLTALTWCSLQNNRLSLLLTLYDAISEHPTHLIFAQAVFRRRSGN